MVFSQELREQIEVNYQAALPFLGQRRQAVEQAAAQCTGEQQLFLKFLYGAMPLSDAANYDVPLFLAYVDHGLFLLKNIPWCRELPPQVFLNDVLFHRVNSEEITNCRPVFFGEVFPVVQGKPMEQAILDLNYWCLQNATYCLTDNRTASPLTVLGCAYGRCGEESTFTVTALRSVGIPARQVYAPKWSHCDDNHAWVEVWCGGQWHYLGACEPEEVLDKGWFTAAASRAMLVHSRTFAAHGPYQITQPGEQPVSKEGCTQFWNQLRRYADVTTLTISVIENSRPVRGANISLELLNYSQFSPIAAFTTGEDGTATVTVGLGDLHLHVKKAGRFLTQKVDTRAAAAVTVDFSAASSQQTEEYAGADFEMLPPKDSMHFWTQLSQEAVQRHQRRFDDSVAIRKRREAAFPTAQQGAQLLDALGYPQPLADAAAACMEKARSNAPQLLYFLQAGGAPKEKEYRVRLLESLTEKDYTDLKAEILQEAFCAAMAYENTAPKDLFVPYVMCPRISLEVLQPWRSALLNAWSREEQNSFRACPPLLWQWITGHISLETQREYSELITTPASLLAVGRGTLLSQKVLFVAACRALGIPARLSPEDGRAQYWDGEQFVSPQQEDQGSTVEFTITTAEKEPWVYFQNWSLARLGQGTYKTLDLSQKQWQSGALTLQLPQGSYRLITCKRMPTGGLFAKEYRFCAKAGGKNTIDITQRTARLSDLLENREIPDFVLKDSARNPVQASKLTAGKKNVLLWLEEGKEPTEHILNEILDQPQTFSALDAQIIFVLHSENALKNEKIAKVLKAVPGIVVCYDDFRDTLSSLARRMYVDPDKLPLVVLTNPGLNGIYGSSGYNVGLGDLIIKILME